jgi:hypothetical protein
MNSAERTGPRLIVLTLAALAGCNNVEAIPPEFQQLPDTIAVDATVNLLNVEGGCWVLTVSGTHLEPDNLPADLRVDGLTVHATIASSKMASVCMVGPVVTIIHIERR